MPERKRTDAGVGREPFPRHGGLSDGLATFGEYARSRQHIRYASVIDYHGHFRPDDFLPSPGKHQADIRLVDIARGIRSRLTSFERQTALDGARKYNHVV